MGKKNNSGIMLRVQIVLYIFFLFLWFISSREPLLRLISVVLLTCFSLLQVAKIIRRKKLYINKAVLLYILFTSWALLSIVWAQDKSMSIDRIMDLVCNSLFFVISYDFFSEARISKKMFISLFVIVGLLFTMYVLMYYGFGGYFSMLLAGKRIGNEIINVNFIGMISTMTIIVLLYSVMNGVYKNKLMLLLIIPPLVTTFGSGSKKALIGLVIGALLIIIFYLKGRFTRKKLITISLFLILSIGSIFAISRLPYFNTVFRRMDAMIMTFDEDSSKSDGSTETRKEFIEEGFHTFLAHPITGIGLNNSGIITREITGTEVYLHCNYVELLACLGIIGFILYYTIYYLIIIKSIQLNKNKAERNYCPLIIAIVLLMIEIGCVTYYEIKTSMYFILMVVLLFKQNWTKASFSKANKKNVLDDVLKNNNCISIDKGEK